MIAASDITMRYGQKTLFEGVSVKFRPGNRYGLIGANGSGKSTFMKILTGQLEASSGTVAIDQGCSLGYLKQDHYEYENERIIDVVCMGNEELWKIHEEREELYSKDDLSEKEGERIGEIEDLFGEAGGYTMEADAAKLLIGLGIEEEQHEKTLDFLQGGFKLRVLLAQVLFGQPDILLLDEPTNHLDMTSRDWLEGFLTQYEGTVVVISHDRYFLNAVCTSMADLDYQSIRMFSGNYDDFMATNAMLLDKRDRDNKQKEKRRDELQRFITRFGSHASKAKQATSRQKELERLDVEKIKPSSRVSPYIRFEAKERLGDKVVSAESLHIGYDANAPLFKDFSCNIGNNEKIAILGKNGIGKSTLLKTLIGKLSPLSGAIDFGETVKFSYFPQDSSDVLSGDSPAIDWLASFAPDETIGETELRSAMGRMLFRGEDAFKPVNVLSGGERARLIVASMLLEGGNVIVLDEPTNHLDLESIESLNYALSLLEETVIFVSHDREFVGSLATRILALSEDNIIDYPGNLADYERAHKK